MENLSQHVNIYPLGDSAIVVEFGKIISTEIHHRVYGFTKLIEGSERLPEVECVPAFTTVTVYYNPLLFLTSHSDPYGEVEAVLKDLMLELRPQKVDGLKIVEIPVKYGGEEGPDFEAVALLHKLSSSELISLHSSPLYTVYMLGFQPGFPYLGGLDSRLVTPRLATPRKSIPGGSVGIGGAQTGVYPLNSPGGWHIIGKTKAKLFDPALADPTLLNMGDRIKFIPVECL
ncbi:MAG TPA: 5-oxoprolinase subunit PxpB [Bacteriovoracaceae bacterium]|nr:5-oxoprolinase subunit PxpB [Bacteriovoracaceae bacterium]